MILVNKIDQFIDKKLLHAAPHNVILIWPLTTTPIVSITHTHKKKFWWRHQKLIRSSRSRSTLSSHPLSDGERFPNKSSPSTKQTFSWRNPDCFDLYLAGSPLIIKKKIGILRSRLLLEFRALISSLASRFQHFFLFAVWGDELSWLFSGR